MEYDKLMDDFFRKLTPARLAPYKIKSDIYDMNLTPKMQAIDNLEEGDEMVNINILNLTKKIISVPEMLLHQTENLLHFFPQEQPMP